MKCKWKPEADNKEEPNEIELNLLRSPEGDFYIAYTDIMKILQGIATQEFDARLVLEEINDRYQDFVSRCS